MSVSFKGINEQVVTFSTVEELAAGTLVTVSANGTVSPCAANGKIVGVVVSSRENIAAVQISGFVTLPYSGSAPALGVTAIAAASDTKIKADSTNGKLVTVLEVDTAALTAGILL
ncbi:MAG: hypothetical protein IKK09_01965 [Clostridia bacterium]|nr:hypothetical protein [Clostridia bacterium]